jgi:ADP-heptose:LPS heptosyltransferase
LLTGRSKKLLLRVRKIVLKCDFSLGDIVMMTSALRDLHIGHPGQFVTDVRTSCPELWQNNPYITRLSEKDPDVEKINCSYPLINRCNTTPYHCLHGFIEFFNERFQLSIKPTAFKGDIHISVQEKAWHSQIRELIQEDIPFWIVAAGGKYDITIKWWDSKRYQEVINYFRGKIQFVQVGDHGHHHPKLEGVIDLRGKTDLRQLIRLVYHSQGVLCPVTGLMHLAAAVETKNRQPPNRPCIVIAGGREPVHWEAYPDHQFIHTNGALPCCTDGGCWKARNTRLRDGGKNDWHGHLCVDVVNGLAHCMDMITSAEVMRRIEMYFNGGVINYLSPRQQVAAERGVEATAKNSYDRQKLNLHNAGMACDRFIQTIPAFPNRYHGRGIVICCNGKNFTNVRNCINKLRELKCGLPVQLWHLGKKIMDERAAKILSRLDAECIDANKMRRKFPARMLNERGLKPYAILHSPFREVLFLDVDVDPKFNPEILFDAPNFQTTGAIFRSESERGQNEKAGAVWKSCALRRPKGRLFETGRMLLDKERCWAALNLCLWFNENSDFYYQYLQEEKETFHLAFRKLRRRYSLLNR